MRKIGIFGGSFDPVHYGHLRPALEILEALALDTLLFIPTGQPPHRDALVASAAQRLAMLKAAIAGEPRFAVDERELRQAATAYTVDTLTALRREHPDDALYLIVGMDAFLGFPTWQRWRELFALAHVVVAHRPGWVMPDTGELTDEVRGRRIQALPEGRAGQVLLQPVTQLEVSATQVRRLAARGADINYLVPPPVRALILDSHCYG